MNDGGTVSFLFFYIFLPSILWGLIMTGFGEWAFGLGLISKRLG